VPCGTTVERLGHTTMSAIPTMEPADAPRTLVADLLRDGDEVVAARGGAAGRGNMALRSGRLQSSRLAEDGQPGEMVTALLALKLVADVGLVGFPNAGKSSLLAAISRARPEVAAYPFTTLHPQLGVVQPGGWSPFSVADIPGLVEGAHLNRGLGHAFLSHIERTSALCYVLDLSAEAHPCVQLSSLQHELEMYQPGLSSRPFVIAANKGDAARAEVLLRELRAEVATREARGELPGLVPPEAGGSRVTAVSALYRRNLERLVGRMHAALLHAESAAHAALSGSFAAPARRAGRGHHSSTFQ